MGPELDTTILLDEYVETAIGHLDAVETALLGLEQQNGEGKPDEGRITLLLGNLHTLKGNSGMMGFSSLQQFIHKLESAVNSVADKPLPILPVFFEALYAAVNAMHAALKSLSENPACYLDFSDELMMLECLTVKEAASWELLTPAGKRDDFVSFTQKSGTLKVNFEKLDELMNLVGELVIHRTALLIHYESENASDQKRFSSVQSVGEGPLP